MTAVRKILHGQKIEVAMGIKFLKRSKPESERVEDDAKVRVTVEETLKEIELNGDVAVKALSQKFDGYAPENFGLNESEILAAMQKVSTRDIEDIRFAQTQIRRFAEEQKASINDIEVETMPGVVLGHKIFLYNLLGAMSLAVSFQWLHLRTCPF